MVKVDDPAGASSRRSPTKKDNVAQIAALERHSAKPPPTKFTRIKPSGTVAANAAATTTNNNNTIAGETVGGDSTANNNTGIMRRKSSVLLDTTVLLEGGVSEPTNDADFCQQLLVDGYVQSFVDFYHLTHRPDPNAPDAATAPKIYTSLHDMAFIRDNLVAAETSRRQGNTTAVYAAYTKLADLYAASMDWRTSIFFHDKCLEVSQLTADARSEMLANNSLGLVSQKMGDYALARRYHERHEEIAKQYDVLEEVAKSNVELYKVYTLLARKEESAGHHESALEMYQLCLGAAKRCFDKTAEGDANGKIGTILLRRGDTVPSIPYLREQYLIAQEMGNSEGKCNAASALALAYETLGEKDKALAELKLVHSISEHAGDAALQSKACRALGTLYSKIGRLEDAYEALKTHYHLVHAAVPKDTDKVSAAVNKLHSAVATSRGGDDAGSAGGGMADVLATAHTATVQDLDLARSFLGVAKGNLIMGAYMVAIQSDLATLLDWKLTRSDVTAKQENDLVPDRVARQERAAAGKKAVEAMEQQQQQQHEAGDGEGGGAGEGGDAGGVDA